MILLYAFIAGAVVFAADFLLFRKDKLFPDILVKLGNAFVFTNLFSLLAMQFLLKIPDVFMTAKHGPLYPVKYVAFTIVIGLILLIVKGFLMHIFQLEHYTTKFTKRQIAIRVVGVVVFLLGMAAFTGTIWGNQSFGDMTPDQFLVNMKSPLGGTSPEVYITIFTGPLPQTIFATWIFAILVFAPYRLMYQNRHTARQIIGRTAQSVIALVLSIAILLGGLAYGIHVFQLTKVVTAYFSDSPFVADNYINPNDVKLEFPEQPRNLIHIYMESYENSYLPRELGGYMSTNLIPELTKLAEEGIVFSNSNYPFGGPLHTSGSGWSVAGVTNMELGVPLMIPMDGNSYGTNGTFLPGAVGLGDILAARGYEQTCMYGADADFGGLTAFYNNHGNQYIFDHKEALRLGKIPEGYKVNWGYEDDKLFEFAKEEITRLSRTGKPFHFSMENADTHFPDGFMTPDTEIIFDQQYANVIYHSDKQIVQFVRWIQQQPFYENTTVVLTGDHNSMDYKFFKDFDPNYLRTPFNLILNAPVNTENVKNRQFAQFDFFPTILASMGIKIEGNRLALGTNLFSDRPTLIEENGVDEVRSNLEQRSNFYIDELLNVNKKSTYFNQNTNTY